MNRVIFAIVIAVFIAVSGFIADSFKPSQKQKALLGKKLFSEKILSKDSSISCASCHKPEFAFADTVPLAWA